MRDVECYLPAHAGMGSAGCRYCKRECQSSWAGDRCHEGHQPAHGQVGSALAGGPGAGRNEPGDRICQQRRGPGSVLSCSSPALTRRAALHATRRSCDLVRPSSVAVAASLVHCQSTLGYRLATATTLCPPEIAFDDPPSEAGRAPWPPFPAPRQAEPTRARESACQSRRGLRLPVRYVHASCPGLPLASRPR